MIASVEKNKLVYILNRNVEGELTISSPLEAHKPQTLVYAICALDVSYENPIFAALEVDYSESEVDPTGKAYEEIEKQLVYYELDLGLNHVVRKWADTVDRTANMLFRVPGGNYGPSGVIVCGEESITYRHINQDALRVAIPRRSGATEDPQRKRYITAGTMYTLKGGGFFWLLQSEDGDLFKVTLDMQESQSKPSGAVRRLKIKYFDTVPVATNICLLRSGFLFLACEYGDRHLYELTNLGDADDELVFDSDSFPVDHTEDYTPVYFKPRPLSNLALVETIESMNPIMGCHVANLAGEDAPQIYTICGTGARSTFRTSRHSLEVLDLVESELPQPATSVWTTKKAVDDEFDTYIVLSLTSMTLVLSIGEDVEEVTDSGFMKETATIAVQQFGEDSLLQVHPKGIRHIAASGRITDWPTPLHRTIVACASNNRQVAIALSSGEINYFECDSDGSLAKSDDEANTTGTVTCLGLGEVPQGLARTKFLAVGCDDCTIRIYTLYPDENDERLKQLSVQAVSSPPSALTIMAMKDRSSQGSSLYVHVGLHSGVYIRTVMDDVTGELSDTRRRFLGTKPVKLVRASVKGENAIIALTSRPWLGYADPKNSSLALTPLSYLPLESGWSFTSEAFRGMIGIHAQDLRIFAIDKIDSNIHQESIPLAYTPRRFVAHPEQPLYYVIEADNHTMAPPTRAKLIGDQDQKMNTKSEDGINGDTNELPPEDFGYPRARGNWASCIQVVDPVVDKQVLKTVELEQNEAAVSIAVVTFLSLGSENYLAVGTAKDMIVSPMSYTCGFIHVYRFKDNGRDLELIHKTQVEEPPLAMLAFKGRLLVGIGRDLRIYDLGKRQLLRKSQAIEVSPSRIMDLQTQGSRIICADQRESLTYVVHKEEENRLIPFVDDSIARYATCITMNDYETTVGGDKFGNVWMLRCPPKVSEVADEPGGGLHLLHEKGYLGGTPNRLDLLMHYFTQDIPMAIEKTSLTPGGEKVIFWAGLQGTLGAFIPFESRKDLKMFQQLELALRNEDKPLAGRDHLAYRGYYVPVKGTIDGDLCERYLLLSNDAKQRVAAALDGSWNPAGVEAKIWNMRGLYVF